MVRKNLIEINSHTSSPIRLYIGANILNVVQVMQFSAEIEAMDEKDAGKSSRKHTGLDGDGPDMDRLKVLPFWWKRSAKGFMARERRRRNLCEGRAVGKKGKD